MEEQSVSKDLNYVSVSGRRAATLRYCARQDERAVATLTSDNNFDYNPDFHRRAPVEGNNGEQRSGTGNGSVYLRDSSNSISRMVASYLDSVIVFSVQEQWL